MRKNKYSNYGRVMSGDELYGFAMDRYKDLLHEAEESRRHIPAPQSGNSKKDRSPIRQFWQIFSQIF